MSVRTRGQLRCRRTWLALGVALLVAVLVGSLLSLPPVEGLMLHDKWLHFVAYGVLMLWFSQIFRSPLARVLLALGLVAFGIGIEYLQGMTATRQFDTLDMVANTLGVLLGAAFALTPAGKVLAALEGLFEHSPAPGGAVRDSHGTAHDG